MGRVHYFELDTLVGVVFDERYKVGALLGEGGQAGVFRAWDNQDRRSVALKVLRPDSSEGGSRYKRFEREAFALMRLAHDNCVRVFATGVDAEFGLHYMVMELVQGQPLDLFVHFPLTLRQVVRIAIGIARGLGQAHGQGIMHRDLKPENVILTPQGRLCEHKPVLLDFGIAKFDENYQMTMLTGSEMVLGTVHYMSPEQAQGYPLASMTDVYSLGVVLFELMVGDPPFDGSPIQILRQHIARQMPALRYKASVGKSERFEAVMRRALEKRPKERYQDGASFAAELDAVLAEIDARPEHAPGTWFDLDHDSNLVAIGYASGEVEARRLDTGERLFRNQLSERAIVQVAFGPGPGELLAIDGAGELMCVGLDEGVVRWVDNPFEGSLTALAASPTGAIYAVASADGRIRVLAMGSDKALAEFRSHRGRVNRMIFDPTGCVLISAGEEGAVVVWDVGELEVQNRFAVEGNAATALALDVSSGLVAMGSDTGRITFGHLDGERRPVTFFAHAAEVSSLAFVRTAGGELDLFSAGFDGELRQWSSDEGFSRPHAGLHPDGVRCAQWSRGGGIYALCDNLLMYWERNFYDEAGGRPDRFLTPLTDRWER